MTHTVQNTSKVQNRSKLLLSSGCVALAMGMMISAQEARAQAINATETFVQGSGNRITPGPVPSETIEIDTPTAVIDWVPFEDGAGNALDFLPTGADVTFENSPSNLGDFAVLNRILPSTNGNVAVIDGIVVSQLRDGMGATTPGGTVAFYSPTGLLIGDNASFDVGNLILTTLDIDIASFDAFTQSGGTLSMTVGPNGPQTVTISPNATITASAENSYFVVTAAQVEMFGTSDVNGTQAFVAGDEVLLTLNNGLFDIEVPIGTSSANAINIDGNVGGPSSTGVGDNHLIYAVAAAQADPISLLFSGNLGFQPAASAGIVNGEIIISANYDVFGRTVTGGTVNGGIAQDFIDNSPQNIIQADVFLTDFTSTSTILAAATNEVQVAALNAPSSVDGNLIMVGRGFSELTASNGQTFDITGSVLVSASDYGVVASNVADPGDLDATGGVAFIDAFGGGTLNIAGDARVTSDGSAGFDQATNVGGTGQGGSAQIGSTGGFLNITGDATVRASGSGFEAASQLLSAGDSVGGTATIFARNLGEVTIGGAGQVFAIGTGRSTTVGGALGSNASGGLALLESTDGGLIDIALDALVVANATSGNSNASGAGATATAGTALALINGTGSISVGGTFGTVADGVGGLNGGGDGGNAFGGTSGISVLSGGSFTAGDTARSRAFGTGGQTLATGATGGTGTAGIAQIVVDGGGTIDLAAEGIAETFGQGGVGDLGGDGFGGVSSIIARVGSISIGGAGQAQSLGIGGNARDGGDGGNGIGGRGEISAEGTLTQIGEITINGAANVSAVGIGGIGGAGDGSILNPGSGGDGIGGSDSTPVAIDPGQTGGALLTAGVDNGQLTIVDQAIVGAEGNGGRGGEGGIGQSGGDGGAGVGGFAQSGLFLLGGGDGSVGQGFADLDVVVTRSSALGGDGGNAGSGGGLRGDGGSAAGGIAEFTILGGSFSGTAVSQVAEGRGGDGNNGGDATGGSATTDAQGGSTIDVTVLTANTSANGGSAADGTAGSATGGLSQLVLFDSTFTASQNVTLEAIATGGNSTGGLGGDATGGTATLDTNATTSVFTADGFLLINTRSTGGTSNSAGVGATATGGNSNIFADAGGSVSAQSIIVVGTTAGGNNNGTGDGGAAFGGASTIFVADGGTLTATGSSVGASALANGGAALGVGAGGSAIGGTASIRVGLDAGSEGTLAAATSVSASATGSGGTGASGGDGTGGSALLQVVAGELNTPGSVSVGATGIGGTAASLAGFGGMGGTGTGGAAFVGAFGDVGRTASIDVGSISVFSDGVGGVGGFGDGAAIAAGQGGAGFGGSTRTLNPAVPSQTNGSLVLIGDINSTINVTNEVSISATGVGGAGGDGGLDQAGGDGGNGLGGTAVFGNVGFGTNDADDLNDGTSVATIAGLALDNSGTGGAGGFGGSTIDPRGNGGDGRGGIADLSSSNDQALVSAAGVTLNIGAIDALSNGTGGDGDISGDGFGGIALLAATSGGIVTAASINAESSGFGGNGRIGGDGNGGGAADPGQVFGGAGVDFRNGTVTITGDANFTASGFGGVSDGADGGIGTGGFATLRNLGLGNDPTLQGDLDIGGFASLLAEGIGGDGGTGAVGGVGQGGLAEIVTAVGGTVEIGTVEITAGGAGGSGASTAGGNGFGGEANIISRDAGSSITINNELGFSNDVSQTGQSAFLSANGGGGAATGGSGVGGNGTGGTASVIATDQGTITLPLTSNFGNRILARAGGGASGVDGGVAGTATGGTGIIELDNGGTITTGRTLLSVFAFGGSSTEAFDPASTLNVDGGDANGGERRITVRGGSTLTGEFFGGTAGGLGGDGSGLGDGGTGAGGRGVYVFEDSTFNAVGRNIFGGGGGSGGGGQTGGDASGGDNDFTVTNSTINMISNGASTNPAGLPDTPSIQIFNQSLNGDGVLQGGNVNGGTIDVTITDSTITGGSFGISQLARAGNADAVIGTGGNATAGSITLNVTNSTLEVQNGEDTQGFVFDPATGMNVPGDIFPGRISDIVSTAQGGAGLIAGNATAGNVDVTFFGGSVTIDPSSTAQGVLEFASSATAGDGTDMLGTAISGRVDVTFTGTNITGDNLLIRSDATSEAIQTGATGGQAFAGSADLVIFGNSAVTLNNLTVSANGTSALVGEAQGGTAGLLIAGLAGVPAPQVNLDILVIEADGRGATPGASNNVHGQFFLDVIDSQLNTRELNASADGDVLALGEVGPSIVTADGGAIEVDEQINLTTFADTILNTVNGGTIGTDNTLNPSPVITITSQNTIQFTGDDDNTIGVAGSVLNLSSADMIIDDGARIGAPDVIITSLNREDTAILGGDGTPGGQVADEGFTLIGEELERIEVGRFTFNQEALPVDPGGAVSNDPSIIVRDYIASGSAGDGVSSISLNVTGTGGILRIEGQAVIEDAISTDTIAFSADERIEIVTPGGIGVVDVDGNPIGTLLIDAQNVWAADAATITQLQNDPNFAGRNELLSSAAAGSDDPLGFIRAGEVSITFGDTLLVRNTGTATQQGGILVGDGGLFITDSTDSIADVFAYGARLDSSTGELVTGEAFFNEVNFFGGSTGSASFNEVSAFNDCLINTNECTTAPPPTTGEPEEPVEPEGPTEEEEVVRQEAAQANNATAVEAAVQTAVEIVATEEESNEDFGMDFPSFVEAEEIEDESDIDDPVASGGDASLYGRGANGNVEVGGSSDGE